ncbi:hypothetical protein [Polyangium jinanense]|uniref:Uncharacterized protein n=1 Tax=Polyangium jinanense TaxID=2829994 RepID=A0A9X4AUM9_9BACT|nr:hypothetical protein [Polyangium jinanense]MDC3956723.1 hypothetical protein [Polyangium jinanense]MDC3984786.1 hypothetical protein [Polyangium jinanense]
MELLPVDKAETTTTARATMRVWRPARRVLVTRVTGYLDDQCATLIEAVARRVAAEEGRVMGFHDWEEMTDYDARARARLTEMARDMGKGNEGAHFLVRSKLVALGIQAASVVMSGVRVHHTRADFEAALRECIQQRSRPA